MFLPAALITRASEPAETPVICQLAMAVPFGRFPTLKVGVLTVKWPFCELRVNETLDIEVKAAVFTLFSITTVTVVVLPTSNEAGNTFPEFPSSMSRY